MLLHSSCAFTSIFKSVENQFEVRLPLMVLTGDAFTLRPHISNVQSSCSSRGFGCNPIIIIFVMQQHCLLIYSLTCIQTVGNASGCYLDNTVSAEVLQWDTGHRIHQCEERSEESGTAASNVTSSKSLSPQRKTGGFCSCSNLIWKSIVDQW